MTSTSVTCRAVGGAAFGVSPTEARYRVLLVEDDRLLAELVSDMLSDMGHEVIGPATDHETALAVASSSDVDVVVLDLMVGGRDTLDIAAVLLTRGVPYVFSTGFGRDVGVGPSASVLSKPYSDEDLRRAVDACVALRDVSCHPTHTPAPSRQAARAARPRTTSATQDATWRTAATSVGNSMTT